MAPKNKNKRVFPKLKISNLFKGIFKSCRDTSGVQVPGAATPAEAIINAAPTTQATVQTTDTSRATPAAVTPEVAPAPAPAPAEIKPEIVQAPHAASPEVAAVPAAAPAPAQTNTQSKTQAQIATAVTPTRRKVATSRTKRNNNPKNFWLDPFVKVATAVSIIFLLVLQRYQGFRISKDSNLELVSNSTIENGLTLTSKALSSTDQITPMHAEPSIKCVIVTNNYAVCGDIDLTPKASMRSQVCGYKSYLPAFARREADYIQQVASVNVTEEASNPTSNPFAPLFMSFTQAAEVVAPIAQDPDARLKAAIEAYALRGR